MKKQNQTVFIVSVVVFVLVILFAIIDNQAFTDLSKSILTYIQINFSWFYLIAMLFFVIFCIGIAASPFGKIRLGPDDSKPEYNTISWFAMLYCAGMGVGLVFWGIAEPLSHYVSPDQGIAPASNASAAFAIRACFMHWGVHPWAAYAVIGLGLAYFQFRKNMPGLISSLFLPFLGEEGVRGPIGKLVDVFAVIVSVAGIATSLGMGCMQLAGGLNFLYGVPNNLKTWLVITGIVCVIYLASSVSGLDKGIKILSDFNLYLAMFLLLACFVIGPTGYIMNLFTNGVGGYISNFITDSLGLLPDGDNTWVYSWRVFYWAWWISWAPFVGIFIARISRGRTIREFIIGVIVVPSIASMIWFSVWGGLALYAGRTDTLENLQEIVKSPETALFEILNRYPFGMILSLLALLVLAIFFITSANAATFVLGELTSEGSMDPPAGKKITWGILQAVIAVILMGTGGLTALQTASIAASFPFALIMLLACIGILKALNKDGKDE